MTIRLAPCDSYVYSHPTIRGHSNVWLRQSGWPPQAMCISGSVNALYLCYWTSKTTTRIFHAVCQGYVARREIEKEKENSDSAIGGTTRVILPLGLKLWQASAALCHASWISESELSAIPVSTITALAKPSYDLGPVAVQCINEKQGRRRCGFKLEAITLKCDVHTSRPSHLMNFNWRYKAVLQPPRPFFSVVD